MSNLDQYSSEVEEWISKKLTKSTIIRRLTEKGVDNLEANRFFEKKKSIYNLYLAKKNRPKWIITSLVYLLLFTLLIPVTYSFNYTKLSGIIGGFIFGYLIIKTIYMYNSFFDFVESLLKDDNKRERTLAVITLIGSIILFIFINHIRTENEFKNYGIKTEAHISEGYEIINGGRPGRKIEVFSLSYTYFTKEKKKHLSEIYVNQSEYDGLYLAKKIHVLYSSRYNEMSKIIKE
jgi:hypothetical protein